MKSSHETSFGTINDLTPYADIVIEENDPALNFDLEALQGGGFSPVGEEWGKALDGEHEMSPEAVDTAKSAVDALRAHLGSDRPKGEASLAASTGSLQDLRGTEIGEDGRVDGP